MGMITRLIRDVNTKSSPASAPTPAIGCMNNLYKSVENLEVKHFSINDCKKMLLFPLRAAEAKCNRLKLKIDHLEPTGYYYCQHCPEQKLFIATSRSSQCSKCSKYFRTTHMLDEFQVSGGGVFVMGGNTRYIVTDDLKINSGSVGACMSILGVHGIHDWNRIEERNVDVSPKEVLSLLQRSLISKTPLTDLILLKGGESSEKVKIKPRATCTLYSKGQETTSSSTNAEVCVTLVINKSTNKSLYAVVKDDFVDLLFNFLKLPLGAIVKLCGGTSSMGCVDNIYKSVEDLSSQGQIVSEYCKTILVNPKLATNGGKFVAGPATYMVTNDLVVTPLCLTTGLVFLKSKNVPMSDVEERIVTVGKQEAFNLLMASLFLDNALDAIMGSTDKVANPTGPTAKKEQVDGM